MVVKINSKPIKVQEDEDDDKHSWVHFGVSMVGYLLAFYMMDLAAYLFLGVHPFPFIKFIGVILSWFGV
jgi:hypothetical protein